MYLCKFKHTKQCGRMVIGSTSLHSINNIDPLFNRNEMKHFIVSSKSIVCSLLLFVMTATTAIDLNAQQKPLLQDDAKYEAQWDKVQQLIDDHYYKDARKIVEPLFDQAVATHNSKQILNSIWYLNVLDFAYVENGEDSAYNRIVRMQPQLDQPDKCLSYMMLYQIIIRGTWSYNPNIDTDEENISWHLWSHQRCLDECNKYIDSILAHANLLFKIPSSEYVRLMDTTQGSQRFTPTLFDVIASHLMNCRNIDQMMALLREEHQNDEDELLLWLDVKEYQIKREDSRRVDLALKYLNRWRSSTLPDVAFFYNELAIGYKDKGENLLSERYNDTIIQRFPTSAFYLTAKKRKEQNKWKSINSATMDDYQIPNHPMLAVLEVSNIDTLYCRIVSNTGQKLDQHMLSQKPVREWSQYVPHSDNMTEQKVYLYLPGVPVGKYVLLVSGTPDFRPDKSIKYIEYGGYKGEERKASSVQFAYKEFVCTDAVLVDIREANGGSIISRSTGQPIPNLDVRLISKRNDGRNNCLATTKTDSNGFFFFPYIKDAPFFSCKIAITYQGVEIERRFSYRHRETETCCDSNKSNISILLDRPIYRPGDTVHFTLCTYINTDWWNSKTSSREVRVLFKDVNRKTIDSLNLTTNKMGAANGIFVIPANTLPGIHRIYVYDDVVDTYSIMIVQVEEYKQPKFYASIEPDNKIHHFGQPIQVKGMARAYSGASMAGAQVSYTVKGQSLSPSWKRRAYWEGYSYSYNILSKEEGTALCDDDGSFVFEFVPQLDSANNVQFVSYTVEATITDVNGETQYVRSSYVLGVENIILTANIIDSKLYRTLDSVGFSLTNLNNDPLDGSVVMTIDKLKPAMGRGLGLFQPNEVKNAIHTLSIDEFQRLYPSLMYSSLDNEPNTWAVDRKVLQQEVEASLHHKTTWVSIPKLETGFYCLTLSALDDEGHRVEDKVYFVFMPEQATKMPRKSKLFLMETNREEVEVGDEVIIRLASSYDVYVSMAIEYADSVKATRIFHFTPQHQVDTIHLTITPAMKGNVWITAVACKENVIEQGEEGIKVLLPERELDMHLTTFRNKLQPGNEETWTLKVQGKAHNDGSRTPLYSPAQVVLSMYDEALLEIDHYSMNYHVMNLPMQSHTMDYMSYEYVNQRSWNFRSTLWMNGFTFNPNTKYPSNSILTQQGWFFKKKGPWGVNSIVATVAGVEYADADYIENEVELVELVEEQPLYEGNSRSYKRASKSGTSKLEELEEEEVVIQSVDEDKGEIFSIYETEPSSSSTPSIDLRTNLSTLGFFQPNLLTDAEGNVSFTFRVPDLLTRWSIRGVAWTQNMAVGKLSASCVTQKQLMVIPNPPRYLRQGDVIDFSVKVSNITNKEQNVTVVFTLTDAATHQPIALANSRQEVMVPAGSSNNVSFRIEVPSNAAVVTYKVVAFNEQHNDGEQANIIVLPNRQLVTESMAMYLNGRQTKQYELQHLLQSEQSSTLQHQSMAIELTSNPIWYAIQSLPFVSECENPSNIYRFHAYYVNSLGRYIANLSPNIEQVMHQWESDTTGASFMSNLQINEDMKQILLDETPWLGNGNNESERKRQVAHFFDRDKLTHQMEDNLGKLLASQQNSGAWMWIDGGRYESPYVTQYILKGVGHLSNLTDGSLPEQWQKPIRKALKYLDEEEYKYYIKYVKKDKWLSSATDIDYLYTRSFFPNQKFSGKTQDAYNFYYENLLKHYTEFEGLYTQAQVALILYRHGNTRQAKKLIERMRQSSIITDEMGMYWRSNVSGYFWNERPIEVQALLIEAFSEIDPSDTVSVALMQQWILKQKQTTHWNSDIASVHAINALMAGSGRQQLQQTQPYMTIQLDGQTIDMGKAQAGSGYQSRRFQADEVKSDMGHITLSKTTPGIAWGAVYWQYFEQLDKIPYSEMGVKMERKLYRVENNDKLTLVTPSTKLHVGDKLRVRILIDCDRNLEYVELRDGRSSTFEPLSSRSGWQWNRGLSYYMAVRNASTSFYIDRLDKGQYMAEYDVWITHKGSFMVAPVTIQCLYAPEFRSTVGGFMLEVGD